ncbi:MAG: DinB family protein [Pyrinomonadaceae bacterium]|nr:DinB family protein [Pyrinomonadaceae bacterium]
METKDMLRQLLAYNGWANHLVIEALKKETPHDPKALRAFAHLLFAEKIWLQRITESLDTTGYDFAPELNLNDCEKLSDENAKAYASFFDALDEDVLDRTATYKNSKGAEYQTSYRDVLTHVLYHSAYHRGQVAMAARAAGNVPAYTDYIAFVREA